MAGAALNTVRYASGLVVRSPVNPVVRGAERFAAPLGELPSDTAKLYGAGAGSAAAIAVGYGIGRVASYFSGRKRKFEEMSSGYATDTQMGGIGYAGATNVVQRSYHSRKLGRKLRKDARNAHRLLQASMAYCQMRWQRMYNYSGTGTTTDEVKQAYPDAQLVDNYIINGSGSTPAKTSQLGRLNLGHLTSGTGSTIREALPGYLFNLTSWRDQADGFSPMNRLYFTNTGSLGYYPICSQEPNADTCSDTKWQQELLRGNTYPSASCQNAFLQWCDVRMAFYGASHCPTRIIVEMIQFKKDYFHPGESLTSDEQSEVNMFYINEFKKLIFHPLDVQLNKRKEIMKTLYRKVYEIGPDTSSSEDPTNPNVLCHIFKRFNRLHNWRWRVDNASTTDNSIEPNKGELDEADWQINDFEQLRDTVAHKARIYLYIRAEAMTPVVRSVKQNDISVAKHCPSMDICVRNKWMYEN